MFNVNTKLICDTKSFLAKTEYIKVVNQLRFGVMKKKINRRSVKIENCEQK